MSNTLPVKIFIAYARKDTEFLDAFRAHIAPLMRSGRVQVWFDGLIEPGAIWDDTIKQNLHSADIILLMVSAHSLSSDYFYGKEVADAMERHRLGTARVVPLILRSCIWQETELGTLQALPKDGIPVEKWNHADDAFENVMQSLNKVVGEIESRREMAERERSTALQAEQTKRENAHRAARQQTPATKEPGNEKLRTETSAEETLRPSYEPQSSLSNKWIETLFAWVPAPYRKVAKRYGLLMGIFYSLLIGWFTVSWKQLAEIYSLPGNSIWILGLVIHLIFIWLALRAQRKNMPNMRLPFLQAMGMSFFTGIIAGVTTGILYVVIVKTFSLADPSEFKLYGMIAGIVTFFYILVAGLILSPFTGMKR